MKSKIEGNHVVDLIKKSLSYAQVLRELNLVIGGANYGKLKRFIKDNNIDISHFTGQAHNVGENYKHIKNKKPLVDVLKENSFFTSSHLRKRLINEGVKYEICESCGLTEWLGQKISLELHHINGDNCDNRIDNLQILCPNCHAQTNNYRIKKKSLKNKKIKLKKDKVEKKINNCIDCETVILNGSTRCIKCSQVKQRRVERPNIEKLLDEIKEFGYVKVGKIYGVSDNTIRKWVK